MLRQLLGAIGACVIVGPAAAHVTLENREAPVGAAYKAVLRVPHGCEGTATTSLRVRIPGRRDRASSRCPSPAGRSTPSSASIPRPTTSFHSQAQRRRDRDHLVRRQAAGRALRRVRVSVELSRRRSRHRARWSTSRSCRNARRACTAGSRFRPRAKGRATIRNPRRPQAVAEALAAAQPSCAGSSPHSLAAAVALAVVLQAPAAHGACDAGEGRACGRRGCRAGAAGAAADVQRAGVAARDPADRSGRPRRSAWQYRRGRCRDRDCGAGPAAAARHVLSWRVMSADGHPVGGALMFSIGAPSAQPPSGAQSATDPAVRAAMWAAKLVIYLGFAVGIGGAFFRAWIAAPDAARAADPWILAALIAGLVATALSVGLQGLDALELSLREIGHRAAWETGLETAYGLTAIAAAFALFAGVFANAATSQRLGRVLCSARARRRRRRAGAQRTRQQCRTALPSAVRRYSCTPSA